MSKQTDPLNILAALVEFAPNRMADLPELVRASQLAIAELRRRSARGGAIGRRRCVELDGILEQASCADITEAAFDLAALCNDADSADDDESTLQKLVEFVNIRRAARGAKPISVKP